MARLLIPDTTAFVHAIREHDSVFFDAVLHGRVWLSAVVACELYAGTRSAEEARLLDRLVDAASRRQRLVVPTAEDWYEAGRLLSRRARLQGALHPRDHLADVLVVVSAARLRGEVVTANRVHFEAWSNLARRAGMDVVVSSEDLQ